MRLWQRKGGNIRNESFLYLNVHGRRDAKRIKIPLFGISQTAQVYPKYIENYKIIDINYLQSTYCKKSDTFYLMKNIHIIKLKNTYRYIFMETSNKYHNVYLFIKYLF